MIYLFHIFRAGNKRYIFSSLHFVSWLNILLVKTWSHLPVDTFLVSWATCTSMCLLISDLFGVSVPFTGPSLSSFEGVSGGIADTSEFAVEAGVVALDPPWLISESSSYK